MRDLEGRKGVGVYSDAVVMRDLFTLMWCFTPVGDKTAVETERGFRDFMGHDFIWLIYSDNAGEIRVAAEEMGIPWESSQPGMPETNAIAERSVGNALDGIRTLLFGARLPVAFGPTPDNVLPHWRTSRLWTALQRTSRDTARISKGFKSPLEQESGSNRRRRNTVSIKRTPELNLVDSWATKSRQGTSGMVNIWSQICRTSRTRIYPTMWTRSSSLMLSHIRLSELFFRRRVFVSL